jgi:hypothetical protein
MDGWIPSVKTSSPSDRFRLRMTTSEAATTDPRNKQWALELVASKQVDDFVACLN